MASVLTPDTLIDAHRLVFDPADKANGSLYLAVPLAAPAALDVAATLTALRAAGLWSAEPEKEVPDAHRAAYKAQLVLVEAVAYRGHGQDFAIARFDHPKFPSDAVRWAAWKTHFDQYHVRA